MSAVKPDLPDITNSTVAHVNSHPQGLPVQYLNQIKPAKVPGWMEEGLMETCL